MCYEVSYFSLIFVCVINCYTTHAKVKFLEEVKKGIAADESLWLRWVCT